MVSEREFVLIRYGGHKGTQLAVVLYREMVLDVHNDRVRVRKWRANSERWTEPLWIDSSEIVGPVPDDKRLARARAAL